MSDQDILGTDLSSVESSFPILPGGMYEVTIAEMKTEANKAGTGSNLKMKYTLVNPATARDGKTVNAGFPLFDLISITKTEKYDPTQRLAQFKEAATGNKSGSFAPIEQYIGMTMAIQLSVEESAEFGTSNRVKRYIKKAG